MAQNLPEAMLRYMNAPVTRKLRGYGAIQESDNNQLVALLANKPDVMTPQAWANAGGANWDADGALYQKYVALRRERGLPTTAAEANPARAAALEAQGLDGDTIEKTLMRQNPTPQPFDARAAALKDMGYTEEQFNKITQPPVANTQPVNPREAVMRDMGTTPAAFDKMINDARALPVRQPDYLGTTPRDIGTGQIRENEEPPIPDINKERAAFTSGIRQFARRTMNPTIGEQLDAIEEIKKKRADAVQSGTMDQYEAARRFPFPATHPYANPDVGTNQKNAGIPTNIPPQENFFSPSVVSASALPPPVLKPEAALNEKVEEKILPASQPKPQPSADQESKWTDKLLAAATELASHMKTRSPPKSAAAPTAANSPAGVAAAVSGATPPEPPAAPVNPNGALPSFARPAAPAPASNTAPAPVATAPAAMAPRLTEKELEDRVAASGDMTFGRNALIPQETTASSTRRVQTSGTGQPTRTASQQMYYYDPGDGGPIRPMGGALPKGMAAGSQQGGGYIFGQEVSPDRTAAQKFVQGDASGVGNALSSLFNKFTAKKPGTVDPLTGKSYEPIAPSEDVQQESRGGKIHSGHATHDGKCHVGIIQMAVGGRTDHLPMNVYANSYVIPADVVSGLGEGNTLSGGHILDRMFSGDSLNKMVSKTVKVPRKASGGPLPISAPMQMGQYQVVIPEVMNFGPPDYEKTGPFGTETVSARANPKFPDARYSWRYTETPPGEKPKAGAARGGMINDRHAKPVEILAAGGEYVIPPEVVRSLGHGNADDGHKWLDNFVKSTRAHTIRTMQKLPGPKKD